jgi:hypothetical protein
MMWGKAMVAAEASEVVRRNERRVRDDEGMRVEGLCSLTERQKESET